MSAAVHFGVVISSLEVLGSVAAQLGLRWRETGAEASEAEARAIGRAVFESVLGERIRVVPGKDNTFELVPENPESKEAQATVCRIRQAYSRLQVLDTLKKRGYKDVKEERRPDGSIRLVVQRWA